MSQDVLQNLASVPVGSFLAATCALALLPFWSNPGLLGPTWRRSPRGAL